MKRPTQITYGLMIASFIIVAWLGLGVAFITTLFCYFALEKLSFRGNKALGTVLFLMALVGAGYAFGYFFHQALQTFPKIAQNAIPAIIQFAKQHNLELPFTDLESLRAVALDTIMEEVHYVGKRATLLGKELVLFVIGVVVAISLYWNPRLDLRHDDRVTPNLFTLICAEIQLRFRSFYSSFARVMGAQLTISMINTGLTSIFITYIHLPYAGLILVVTLICGLLPIVGNLISNTVIVCIAFTLSPQLGIASLVFLVLLHKLEYLLNSKIIGGRIHNPMWLTLVALIVAERIMGVPGLILAPVVLDYLKRETSQIKVLDSDESPEPATWSRAG